MQGEKSPCIENTPRGDLRNSQYDTQCGVADCTKPLYVLFVKLRRGSIRICAQVGFFDAASRFEAADSLFFFFPSFFAAVRFPAHRRAEAAAYA